jgi:hypothetical protein
LRGAGEGRCLGASAGWCRGSWRDGCREEAPAAAAGAGAKARLSAGSSAGHEQCDSEDAEHCSDEHPEGESDHGASSVRLRDISVPPVSQASGRAPACKGEPGRTSDLAASARGGTIRPCQNFPAGGKVFHARFPTHRERGLLARGSNPRRHTRKIRSGPGRPDFTFRGCWLGRLWAHPGRHPALAAPSRATLPSTARANQGCKHALMPC